MTQSDAYYRALLAWRAEMAAKRECARDSHTVTTAGGNESLTVTRVHVTVDEEWIKAIEEGLVFIEKAIKEERQFIYSNGEVIPIEKVKNVSKDSVEHLARHAELITREQEGEDLIPDKLYTVERINDYTVYENRFLYMLLCYLRDFVTLRYQKIVELTNRYDGKMELAKEVHFLSRKLNIEINMHDERKDDPYLKEHNPAKSLIDRIDLILKTVLSFLATPLMESAGKAPMLKPPITKTNVLKMDNNFKGAVKLYEYIIAYEGDGYTTRDDIKNVTPFHDSVAEDMARSELFISFLTYMYGLDLEGMLKEEYELEESRRRQKELKAKTEQLAAIRRRLANEGKEQEEYIAELEAHARALQKEVDKTESLCEEINVLAEHERLLSEDVATLSGNLERLEADYTELKIAHAEQIRAMQEEHMREIAQIKSEHDAYVAELNQAHGEAIAELNQKHAETIGELDNRRKAELSEQAERYNAQLTSLSSNISEQSEKIKKISTENSELTEKNNVLSARVLALRSVKGEVSREERDKLTAQEDFDELERQLESFVRFYKKEWTLAKRKIRKDLLNLKYIKGQSDKK